MNSAATTNRENKMSDAYTHELTTRTKVHVIAKPSSTKPGLAMVRIAGEVLALTVGDLRELATMFNTLANEVDAVDPR